jgi:hypothetical protein
MTTRAPFLINGDARRNSLEGLHEAALIGRLFWSFNEKARVFHTRRLHAVQ